MESSSGLLQLLKQRLESACCQHAVPERLGLSLQKIRVNKRRLAPFGRSSRFSSNYKVFRHPQIFTSCPSTFTCVQNIFSYCLVLLWWWKRVISSYGAEFRHLQVNSWKKWTLDTSGESRIWNKIMLLTINTYVNVTDLDSPSFFKCFLVSSLTGNQCTFNLFYLIDLQQAICCLVGILMVS